MARRQSAEAHLGPTAAAVGLGSLLAIELRLDIHVNGALNLYGLRRRQVGRDLGRPGRTASQR